MSDSLPEEQATKRPVRRRAATSRGESAAPRKRAVRKSSPVKRAVRGAAPANREKKLTEKKTPEPAAQSARKAPTPLADSKARQRHKKRSLIVIGMVILVGIGSSAAVGFTDEGQIDVNKTIEARNERIRTNQADERDTLVSSVEVPVQNTGSRKADGGLIGLGQSPAPAQPVPAATSTATSSDATASSTDVTATSSAEVVEEENTEDGTEASVANEDAAVEGEESVSDTTETPSQTSDSVDSDSLVAE